MQQTTDFNKDINAFVQLGNLFSHFGGANPWPGYTCGLNAEEYAAFDNLIAQVRVFNGWFTEDNVRFALAAWGEVLTEANLRDWLADYLDAIRKNTTPKKVAVIMAGNLPLVGFHDLLAVILSGNTALVKLSSQDDKLWPAILQMLFTFEPSLKERIQLAFGKLEGFDAVIATGSDNTARYFHSYFGKYPHIIRKNRTSVAILNGGETDEELKGLGEDLFRYFGLGCRNVSKLYLPEGFDLDRIFGAIFDWKHLCDHNKYGNNYDYHKALFLMNKADVLENGFVLFKKDTAIHSPVGTVFYEYYTDEAAVRERLREQQQNIQCIVSQADVAFGQTQRPALNDYADGVDTMAWLTAL